MFDADGKIKEIIKTIMSQDEMNRAEIQVDAIKENVQLLGNQLSTKIENSKEMLKFLDGLIHAYEFHNSERTLIDLFDKKVHGSEINLFIKRLKNNQQDTITDIKTSTNKLIHELFVSLILEIAKGQSFLEICYNLRTFYSGGKVLWHDETLNVIVFISRTK